MTLPLPPLQGYQPTERLKSCKLWQGSSEALAHRYDYLTRGMLEDKYDRLLMVNDRTTDEKELMEALAVELT